MSLKVIFLVISLLSVKPGLKLYVSYKKINASYSSDDASASEEIIVFPAKDVLLTRLLYVLWRPLQVLDLNSCRTASTEAEEKEQEQGKYIFYYSHKGEIQLHTLLLQTHEALNKHMKHFAHSHGQKVTMSSLPQTGALSIFGFGSLLNGTSAVL